MRESCRSFRRALLVTDPAAASSRHADECEECRRFRDAERATTGLLQEHRPAFAAPAALRERVTAVLAAERSREKRPGRWPRRAALSLAGALALAAALAVIVLVRGWPSHGDGRGRAHATAELIVEDHLEYARQLDRVQFASDSPAALQAWFEGQIHLAAKIPTLEGATLLGGRRCNLGGRPAALAFFERRGAAGEAEPISLFVVEPAGEDWSTMPEVSGVEGKRACRHHERGVGMIVWEERGLVYVLAAALDAGDLAGLIATPPHE